MSEKPKRGRSMLFGGGLGLLLLAVCQPAPGPDQRTVVVFPAKVVEVIDGETVRIRALIECDVHLEGLELGPDASPAIADLEKSIDKGAAVLFPAGGSKGLTYINSLFTARRVAANIRLDGESETLSERLIRLGHAVPINKTPGSR